MKVLRKFDIEEINISDTSNATGSRYATHTGHKPRARNKVARTNSGIEYDLLNSVKCNASSKVY